MNTAEPLGNFCSIINEIPHTAISTVWTFVGQLFTSYWYIIIPTIVLWVTFEILTRSGHHYNSDNGFTPVFNSFVGGLVFYLTLTLIDLVLEFLFGKIVNCSIMWIRSFYLIPFISTGLLLHGVGFWPYLKIPIINSKITLFRNQPLSKLLRARRNTL